MAQKIETVHPLWLRKIESAQSLWLIICSTSSLENWFIQLRKIHTHTITN